MRPSPNPEIGDRLGRLVLVADAGRDPRTRRRLGRFKCDCGTEITLGYNLVKTGNTSSCGCLRKDQLRTRSFKHGGGGTPEYAAWFNMLQRCYNPENCNYKKYGAKGVTVCAEWIGDFAAFLADMGERPNIEMSLDRIENSGNYEKGNCRWATRNQQRMNRADVNWITFDGKTMCLKDWATHLGVSYQALTVRFRNKWSTEKMLTTPVASRKKAKV